MASNFAGGWAENSARQWFGVGGKREWSNIAIDAFGNALGNSIAGSYQKEAGENMTAALRERTLATDQEKIQAHYAALGQELRRSREIQAQLASAAPSAGATQRFDAEYRKRVIEQSMLSGNWMSSEGGSWGARLRAELEKNVFHYNR
ncbi:hypothetical protein [Pseudaeromonas paramecii]|uniref:Uncharacterized protein n=1 Tax=Pseudaeromonas paramecii TaxID=2138166 RepID=A0ABP8Q0K1_9GAMM